MKETLPPYDLDAEEAVLGSLLIDSESITEIDTIIGAEDFFSEQNQLVYTACRNLFLRDEAINQITVAQDLVASPSLMILEGGLSESFGVHSAYFFTYKALCPNSIPLVYHAASYKRSRSDRIDRI